MALNNSNHSFSDERLGKHTLSLFPTERLGSHTIISTKCEQLAAINKRIQYLLPRVVPRLTGVHVKPVQCEKFGHKRSRIKWNAGIGAQSDEFNLGRARQFVMFIYLSINQKC